MKQPSPLHTAIGVTPFEASHLTHAITPEILTGSATDVPPPESDSGGVKGMQRFNRTSAKTAQARRLRRASTDVETRLWQRLRSKQLGVDFRRQHPAGPYVLDFYCPSLCLAIELDGGQHARSDMLQRDEKRTRWLAERNVMRLRYWNSDVTQNLSGVLEDIAANVASLQVAGLTPTRRWRADLPLAGGGTESRGRALPTAAQTRTR